MGEKYGVNWAGSGCKRLGKSGRLKSSGVKTEEKYSLKKLVFGSGSLAIIFNNIFESSELPTAWKTSFILTLHKKGKKSDVSNYRPISITSSSCKVMESIIHDSISSYLLSNDLLSDHQHGFLKKRSTLTNLLHSIRNWHSSLDDKKSTDIIYIDFAKAFDSVSHPKLLHKLKSYGITGNIFKFISAWLADRYQIVKLEGYLSIPKLVRSGVLQGSVLGPLLFLIFINDLVDCIPPEAHPSLFADDIKLFSDSETINTPNSPGTVYCPLLQSSLDAVFNWSRLWQLGIATSKCSCLSISNLRTPQPRSYNINSFVLPQVTSCRDLGVIIDDKLSFSPHVLFTAKKASIRSYLISRCFHSRNPKILTTAFVAYVRPILEYVSPVWSPHLSRDIELLESVQRRFSKSFHNLSTLPYSTRLTRLSLPSLLSRRIKTDLSTCFLITNSLTHLNSSIFFTPRHSTTTRGHPFTLSKPKVRLNSSKFSFFCRVIDHWNSLPPNIVSAGLYSVFKARLNSINFPDLYNCLAG